MNPEDAGFEFVKGNNHLQKLGIHLSSSDIACFTPSTDLLDAIDSDPWRLEDASITAPGIVDQAWCDKVKFLANLNRQRRLVRPLFASIFEKKRQVDRSNQLYEALDAIDEFGSLFEFLRRGELGLLSILRCCHDSQPAASLSGTKRSIDQVE